MVLSSVDICNISKLNNIVILWSVDSLIDSDLSTQKLYAVS